VRPTGVAGRTFERKIMDYELAKQLKDAEFSVSNKTILSSECAASPDGEDCASTPILEKLIEACGDP